MIGGLIGALIGARRQVVDEVLLFANSIAGRGRGKAIATRVSQTLTSAGYGVREFLERPEQIAPARLQGERPARAAIVIGGDGTLRNVAELLFKAFEPDRLPPLVVVPLGTANLIAKHLAIDWQGARAATRIVAAIAARKIVLLDAARANGQLFLLMTGAGLEGHIIHELDRVRVGPIDLTSYVFPVAIAMHKYTYPAIRVAVDGELIFGPTPGMAFIANAPEYGIGFPILPEAKSDDGLLDICVLPCNSRTQILDLLLRAAAGEHLDVEGVEYRRGKHIRVDADQPIAVQVDGEAAGFTPLEVELLRVKVPFIVP
jgi:diacylglycerol kinase (ATP)